MRKRWNVIYDENILEYKYVVVNKSLELKLFFDEYPGDNLDKGG